MRNLLDVKFDEFIEDFGLQGESEESNWKRFVNYHLRGVTRVFACAWGFFLVERPDS